MVFYFFILGVDCLLVKLDHYGDCIEYNTSDFLKEKSLFILKS